jgi:hypothetical protein
MCGELVKDVGVEAGVDVFLAGGQVLGEKLSRNGRLCGGGLRPGCVLVLGNLEARVGGCLLEIVPQALFRGAGLVLRVRCKQASKRLAVVSPRTRRARVCAHLSRLSGLACSARRLAAQFAGRLEDIEIVPVQQSVLGAHDGAGATYCPLLAQMSAMCSLSHSSSLRTEKPKSSSSCETRSLDWWRSSRIHPAEPMAGTLLRPAIVVSGRGKCACGKSRRGEAVAFEMGRNGVRLAGHYACEAGECELEAAPAAGRCSWRGWLLRWGVCGCQLLWFAGRHKQTIRSLTVASARQAPPPIPERLWSQTSSLENTISIASAAQLNSRYLHFSWFSHDLLCSDPSIRDWVHSAQKP